MTELKDIMSMSEPIHPNAALFEASNAAPFIQNPKYIQIPERRNSEKPLMISELFVPKLQLLSKRSKTCPQIKYCGRSEFDAFAGEWLDSKGDVALISPLGVIRYPEDPNLRFEAIYLGPNHLSVCFDENKCIAKLNHDCTLIIWSNGVKWIKKGSKSKNPQTKNDKCMIQ
eukprot:247373_1